MHFIYSLKIFSFIFYVMYIHDMHVLQQPQPHSLFWNLRNILILQIIKRFSVVNLLFFNFMLYISKQ